MAVLNAAGDWVYSTTPEGVTESSLVATSFALPSGNICFEVLTQHAGDCIAVGQVPELYMGIGHRNHDLTGITVLECVLNLLLPSLPSVTVPINRDDEHLKVLVGTVGQINSILPQCIYCLS